MTTVSGIEASDTAVLSGFDVAVEPDLREVACRLERVDVRRAGRRVLANVTVDLIEGETTAIVGMPGSGRSTFARIVAGVDELTCGRMWVDGSPAARLSDHDELARRRRGAGLVMAPEVIASPVTPLEFLRASLTIDGVDARSALHTANEALTRFGVGAGRHRRLDRVGRDERMRVAMASADALEPRLVVADDFGCGQEGSATDRLVDRDALERLARSCRERGACAVIVTDDPEVAGAADRVIALDEGTIYADHTGLDAAGAARVLHELATFAILRA